MSKYTVETEAPQMTSQHGAYMLRAGLARLYSRMRIHTPTRPGTYMHALTPMHTKNNMWYLLVFRGNNDSPNRLNVTIHVQCPCFSIFNLRNVAHPCDIFYAAVLLSFLYSDFLPRHILGLKHCGHSFWFIRRLILDGVWLCLIVNPSVKRVAYWGCQN
jgi:hypothetical protein